MKHTPKGEVIAFKDQRSRLKRNPQSVHVLGLSGLFSGPPTVQGNAFGYQIVRQRSL